MSTVPVSLPAISAVLPTYNRCTALKVTLPGFLRLRGLAQLVIVDDGSTDATRTYLSTLQDRRVSVVRHTENLGSPRARMTGVRASTSEWILMLDDDCAVPPDYGETLWRVATDRHADVVGAPWIHAPATRIQSEVAKRRQRAVSRLTLSTPAGTFPNRDIITPLLPTMALIHRPVFDVVAFDPGYRGNSWREETAFFIEATRAGFRCILTPSTYYFQAGEWPGGQHGSRLAYECWATYNNLRFLSKHGRYLSSAGYASPPVVEAAHFVLSRVSLPLRAWWSRR